MVDVGKFHSSAIHSDGGFARTLYSFVKSSRDRYGDYSNYQQVTMVVMVDHEK